LRIGASQSYRFPERPIQKSFKPMQSTAPTHPRPASGAPRTRLSALVPTLAAAALLCLLGGWQPATAQVIVGDLQTVSMQFGTSAQDGVRAHQSQVRTRQARVRQARSRANLPRFANNVTMSSDRASIPLQNRHAAPPPPDRKLLAPSTTGVLNSFIQGDLHTDSDNRTASSLSTTDLTVGSDYRHSDHLMMGLAAGRMSTGDTVGNTMSAFLTLQPVDRIYVDMSLSYGEHNARDTTGVSAGSLAGGSVGGTSRGFSLSLNHPRQVGEWFWSPYSRYDHVVTDVSATMPAYSTTPLSYGFSAVSMGSTAQTTWTTPFGALHPMLMVEVQKEVRTVTGLGTTTSLTQGIVGFGFTTKVSRNMSAFAQSRYESDLGATLDRQMMLGMKVAF
jgi:outer membrane autotransporter protein